MSWQSILWVIPAERIVLQSLFSYASRIHWLPVAIELRQQNTLTDTQNWVMPAELIGWHSQLSYACRIHLLTVAVQLRQQNSLIDSLCWVVPAELFGWQSHLSNASETHMLSAGLNKWDSFFLLRVQFINYGWRNGGDWLSAGFIMRLSVCAAVRLSSWCLQHVSGT